MGALDFIVRSGRALYVGISSYNSEQTRRAVAILTELGTPCVIHQPSYSMLNRWVERDGLKVWVYGTSNPVHESNRQIEAWAVDAWCFGATGLVPWQTIDRTGQAMTVADQLGLFIFDRDSTGRTVIRHSMRLKAYREAQQLIETLILVRERHGWSPSRLREFVAQYLPLSGEVRKIDDADAGTAAYDAASLRGIDDLRQACIELLR